MSALIGEADVEMSETSSVTSNENRESLIFQLKIGHSVSPRIPQLFFFANLNLFPMFTVITCQRL